LGQVVERPEQQHHGRNAIRRGKRARIRHAARRQPVHCVLVPGTRDGDKARHRVDQSDLVSTLGQPERVGPGRPADVEHGRRRRGGVPEDELTSSELLEAKHAELQT
jgi:hypothetical protein